VRGIPDAGAPLGRNRGSDPRPAVPHKMENNDNNGDYDKDVDERSTDMDHKEAQQPENQ
jgi:hypothetical protein